MADDNDILTLAEGQTALRQGASTANNTVIAALITACSRRIDRGVGPVVIRTVSSESVDGTGTFVQLANWPVVTVSEVIEDGVTLTADQYHCDTEKGHLYRRNGDFDYPWECGRDNLEITYTAGRYATTALVDEWWKHGCRLLLRHMWRAEQWQTSGFTGAGADFDVPQVAYPAGATPKSVIQWFAGLWRQDRGGFA